jgi:malto-oligosyltrehalose trehalohydrolase
MPFGAAVLDAQRTRFRLWAPAARTVDLCLENRAAAPRPMRPASAGWFEIDADDASPGTRYRYRIDGDLRVPDPASRCNPEDVHGASEVIAPGDFDWGDGDWRGRPWEEAVVYELHVGTFTPEGTFRAIEDKLDYLAGLGVTAIELMPLADFPGRRGWGYDGVLPFAPEASYGRPEDLKRLVQSAHQRGLMMMLDVVYNHFGPDGNYLHAYAPRFFTDRYHTPWGQAINFDGEAAATVREFFAHNALYWLEEYHFDGLRFDAVHAIHDRSQPDFLTELAQAARQGPGSARHVHLVLENDDNAARRLRRDASGRAAGYTAQWNDDIHHAVHVALTGELDGYYADYADAVRALGRCLAEGYAYQGEPSPFRDGSPRGEASTHLPPAAFVSFMQNHDQVGNRAYGERLSALVDARRLEAAAAILLLAPSPPLLFMGEEFGAITPFLFFCDFSGDLARAVTEGRRREFARFERFTDPAVAATIPDPVAPATFLRSKLDWACLQEPRHAARLTQYRELLALRRREIVPLLPAMAGAGRSRVAGNALEVRWDAGARGTLVLRANLADAPATLDDPPQGRPLYSTHPDVDASASSLPSWSAMWLIES